MTKAPKDQTGRPMTGRLNIMIDQEILDALDEWRRQQRDLPPRADAVRRILAEKLRAVKPKG